MRKKVWLVEDDDDIRAVIEMLLTESDYDVVCFSNATTFKSALFQIDSDIVILDVRLPDGNGMDLCLQLKAGLGTDQIPVLMMSANTSVNEIEISCHPDGIIQKPFDIEEFIDKVDLLSKSA